MLTFRKNFAIFLISMLITGIVIGLIQIS
jgi:hypothetical protein